MRELLPNQIDENDCNAGDSFDLFQNDDDFDDDAGDVDSALSASLNEFIKNKNPSLISLFLMYEAISSEIQNIPQSHDGDLLLTYKDKVFELINASVLSHSEKSFHALLKKFLYQVIARVEVLNLSGNFANSVASEKQCVIQLGIKQSRLRNHAGLPELRINPIHKKEISAVDIVKANGCILTAVINNAGHNQVSVYIDALARNSNFICWGKVLLEFISGGKGSGAILLYSIYDLSNPLYVFANERISDYEIANIIPFDTGFGTLNTVCGSGMVDFSRLTQLRAEIICAFMEIAHTGKTLSALSLSSKTQKTNSRNTQLLLTASSCIATSLNNGESIIERAHFEVLDVTNNVSSDSTKNSLMSREVPSSEKAEIESSFLQQNINPENDDDSAAEHTELGELQKQSQNSPKEHVEEDANESSRRDSFSNNPTLQCNQMRYAFLQETQSESKKQPEQKVEDQCHFCVVQ